MTKSKIYIIKVLLLIPFISFSQVSNTIQKDIGQPLITYYNPKNYNASYQNWCVLQDDRGIMYFGNTEGILEFDGCFWQLIKTPNNSIVRSLSMDNNGRIYVAASSDFGYLAPDSTGQLKFVSLLQFLDGDYHEFGDVWDVAAASHGVYFKTRDKIFRWFKEEIKIFDSVNSFRLYKIDDDIFTRNNTIGLCKISGDSVILIPDGGKFSETGVFDMLPLGSRILITTSSDGVFLYDKNTVSRFETEADIFLKQNRIYNACILKDGNIAFATMRGGIAIINSNGTLVRKVNSKNGLYSDIVYDVFPDKEGGLWLAMGEGISRLEASPVFSILPKTHTGNNSISALYRFGNKLYASNSFGLFYLDESSSSFKPVEGINSGGMNYVSIGNNLFGASNNMVYRIDDKTRTDNLFGFEVPLLYKSKIDSNVIYIMYRIGLAVLRYNNGKLRLIKDTRPIGDEMLSLAEDSDGSLWIKTYYEGIVHIRSTAGNLFDVNSNQVEINRYYKNEDLPGNEYNLFSVDDKVLFATDAGLFSFDSQLNTFKPESILGDIFTNSTYFIQSLEKDHKGDLWILVKTQNGSELGKAVRQNNGEYLWKPDPVFRPLDFKNVNLIYSDYYPEIHKEYLWISTNERLIRYEPMINKNYDQDFSTYIRRVIVNDSILYNGVFTEPVRDDVVLSYNNNNIQFKFSASSFIKPGSNLYQYYLEGNDDGWSQWSSETVKEYTNLSSGEYRFRIRSKNVYGTAGKEDIFAFSVLPPWYFSWWAYFIYGFVFLGLLYQIRNFEIKRINKKHSIQLELMKYEKLKELDQLKSQFFANISHEFRTPLTLILGQVDSVMSSKLETKEKAKLQVANRNAKRLLTLINQLLDLSKLEAGSMELNAEKHNIVSFLKSLFYSFESLVEVNKITLKFVSEYENIPVSFDPDKMEKVFYNLISNALKFTSVNGEIKVSLDIIESSEVKISIKDSGIGIPADRLHHIFDRFYQVDSSMTREHEGTGIGLALTKELIELHRGNIAVHSKEGEGSEFVIKLPVSDLKTKNEEVYTVPDYGYNLNKNLNDFAQPGINAPFQSESTVPETVVKSEIVLIVEDNSDVRSYIREQLEGEYNVIDAGDGEDGILKAESEIPDLIITDVMMPKTDGYQFSRKIRSNEKTSHIPIIMLTAKAALDDKIEGLETGIDAYLTKPFSAKELKVRVKNLILQRKNLRKKFSGSTVIKPSEVSAVSTDQMFLEKTLKIIEKHFEDEQFGVDKLADEVNMSVSQLNRKLNALIDQPPGQLIRSLRLQRAADLLKQNAGTVAEICYKVGFNDQAYFSRAFKKQFGHSPSDHKKNNISHSR